MRKILVLAGILVLGLYSCKKDHNEAPALSGKYTEFLPYSGRSVLEFTSGHIVTRTEPGFTTSDSYYYEIADGKISLMPTWTTEYPASEFDFRIIDATSFEIQNLYPSIPENPKSYMTYKK